MRRSGVLALPLLTLGVLPVAAETCSRSTLASTDYAYARWCGDPAAGGTLRVARRDGRAVDYLAVPADTYRELTRTHQVARFLSAEVEPRYRRLGALVPKAEPVRAARIARLVGAGDKLRLAPPPPPAPPRR